MIVGHNPTLSDLVSLLVLGSMQPQICDLKKGGVAALSRTGAAPRTFTTSTGWRRRGFSRALIG